MLVTLIELTGIDIGQPTVPKPETSKCYLTPHNDAPLILCFLSPQRILPSRDVLGSPGTAQVSSVHLLRSRWSARLYNYKGGLKPLRSPAQGERRKKTLSKPKITWCTEQRQPRRNAERGAINLKGGGSGETSLRKMMPDQPFEGQTVFFFKESRNGRECSMQWVQVKWYEKCDVLSITRSWYLSGRSRPSEIDCRGRNEQARRQMLGRPCRLCCAGPKRPLAMLRRFLTSLRTQTNFSWSLSLLHMIFLCYLTNLGLLFAVPPLLRRFFLYSPNTLWQDKA